ncbi:MAG: transcription termination/antitermination protein NusA [Lachnospiraceae bacterium]|nr:transcription termination/antitermination protein NusA [Lachnospiraceae bacterium]
MSEIIKALEEIEKEKNISKEVLIRDIEKSLVIACKSRFGGNDSDYEAHMDCNTGEYSAYMKKLVVESVADKFNQISLTEAKAMNDSYELGDYVKIKVDTNEFNRIAAITAKNVIIQAINEGERFALYQKYAVKEKDIITGEVQSINGNNINITLDDKTDTVLTEKEQVPGEVYKVGDRIKLYVVSVTLNDNNDKDNKDKKDNRNKKNKKDKKGFRVLVSRTHKELVKRLFEKEVTEIADGTVEIMSIAREPGSRSKIAVKSNNKDVDPVGACVGHGGNRVNNIVDDLKGEKIDIINWDEDPAVYIKNSLSPSDVISVTINMDDKNDKREAVVVVPDDQLSLAIGKEGQNVRLAHHLTDYKIDIKSESQAKELGILDDEDDFYED